ncbi:MAG: hypothetical protein U1E87_11025 [Alphaproteobacteria bacterium]
MIGFLKRSVGAVRAVLFAQAAEDRAARHQHEQAMPYLTRMYDALGGEMPSARALIEMNMLCSNVAFKLGRYELAVDAARLALRQIDGKKPFSEEEKDYLRYYCKVVFEACERETDYRTFDSRLIDVKFSSLRFEKVRSRLRREFPITDPAVSEESK